MYRLTLGRRYLLMGIICFIASVYIGLNIKVSATYSYVGIFWRYTGVFTLLLTLIAAAVCFAFKSRRIREVTRYTLIITWTIILGFMYGFSVRASYDAVSDFMASQTTLYCKVYSEPGITDSGKTKSFNAEVYMTAKEGTVTELKSPVKILVYFKYDFKNASNGYTPYMGDWIYITRPDTMENTAVTDDGFDYGRYLRQSETAYTCYTTSLIKAEGYNTAAGKPVIYKLGDWIRNAVFGSVAAYPYGTDEAALLKGILMGDKTDFTDEGYANLSESGFIHIAAVSGMHVSYLLLILTILFKLLKIPRRFSVPAVILCLAIFAAASGFTPSVCRAVLMMSIALAGFAVRRTNDALTTVGIAAAVLIISNPYYIENTSALLSFGATVGILVYYRPVRRVLRLPYTAVKMISEKAVASKNNASNKKSKDKGEINKKSAFEYVRGYGCVLCKSIADSVGISIAAAIGLVYFMARIFGSFRWGSILGNIAVIPLTGVIFIVGAINSVLFYVNGSVAYFVGKGILNPALKLMNRITEVFSAEAFSVSLPMPRKSFFFVYILLCIGFYVLTETSDKSDS